jgi:hypothetical protein
MKFYKYLILNNFIKLLGDLARRSRGADVATIVAARGHDISVCISLLPCSRHEKFAGRSTSPDATHAIMPFTAARVMSRSIDAGETFCGPCCRIFVAACQAIVLSHRASAGLA